MIRVTYKPDGERHEYPTATVAVREVLTRNNVAFVGDWLLKTAEDGDVVAIIAADGFEVIHIEAATKT